MCCTLLSYFIVHALWLLFDLYKEGLVSWTSDSNLEMGKRWGVKKIPINKDLIFEG